MKHAKTAILASIVLGLMLFVAMSPGGPQEKNPVPTNHRPVEIPNVVLTLGNNDFKAAVRDAHPGSPGNRLSQRLADPEAAPPMVTPTPVPQPAAPVEPGEETLETPAGPAEPVRADPSFGPVPAARPTIRPEWIEPPTFKGVPDPMAGNSPLLVMVGLMSMGMVLAVKTVRMP